MSKEVVTVFFHDKTAQRIKKVSHEIVNVFSGYIGGQVTDELEQHLSPNRANGLFHMM